MASPHRAALAGVTSLGKHVCVTTVDKPNTTLDLNVSRDGGDEYRTLQLRLDSYRRWPSSAALSPRHLAEEGFYYTGIRDEIRCFTCEVLLRLLKPEDNVRERHRLYSPACSFLRTLDAIGNRSLEMSEWYQSPPAAHSHVNMSSVNAMRMESRRLASFQSFPLSCPVRPDALAQAGFYYTGRDDGVQCFSCHIALRGWEVGDTPEGEHRRHNPFCPFLNGKDNTNIPLGGSMSEQNSPVQIQSSPNFQFEHIRLGTFGNWPSTSVVSPDDLAEAGFLYAGERDVVRCFHCHVQIEQWLPGDVPVDEHLRQSRDCSYARAVAQRKQRYDNMCATPNAETTAERMKDYEQRLESFQNWPQAFHVSAKSLATAGFYYTGSGDGVRCFLCNGALRGWQQGDSAWGEHMKYFPSCEHVLQHWPGVAQSHDEPWTQPETKMEPATSSASTLLSSSSVNMSDFTQQAKSMGVSSNLAHHMLRQQSLVEEAQSASQVMSGPTLSVSRANTLSQGASTALQPTAPQDTEGIRSELERIRESRLCKICMEKEMTILFLPCAHILCCESCAQSVSDCPVCRTPIQSKIRSYFA